MGKGQSLEPENKDWEKEIEKTERLRIAEPESMVRQLVLTLLPEIVPAWLRGGDATGVLQLQVKASLQDFGTPKWRLLRESRSAPKCQIRYAFQGRRDYL